MSNKFKIGNVELANHVIVGPMAGISNIGFRSIMKEYGAGLIYSEMISDKALAYNNQKTFDMCKIEASEKPIALQLFGHDIDSMIVGAKYLDEKTDCAIIDVNMGCPVKKVVTHNGGSALMKDPAYAFELMKAIVDNVKKPVTVKMRAGWDSEHINAVEMALLMEKAGVSAVAIHPRTRPQFYTGHSDWSLIGEVKKAVKSIPVIGNGDINSVDDSIAMYKQTGCDAIMVSRGALGNPWLIKQLVNYEENGELLAAPGSDERLQQCLDHALRLISLKGENNAIREMRSHACWYLNGLRNGNKVKVKINEMETYNDLLTIVEEYKKALATDDFSYFE